MTGLARIEARWEKATPGPWYWNANDVIGGYQVANRDAPSSQIDTRASSPDREVADFCLRDDAEAIAAAPVDVRLLVAVAKAAKDVDRALYLHRVGCADEHCSLCDKAPILRDALAGLDGAP